MTNKTANKKCGNDFCTYELHRRGYGFFIGCDIYSELRRITSGAVWGISWHHSDPSLRYSMTGLAKSILIHEYGSSSSVNGCPVTVTELAKYFVAELPCATNMRIGDVVRFNSHTVHDAVENIIKNRKRKRCREINRTTVVEASRFIFQPPIKRKRSAKKTNKAVKKQSTAKTKRLTRKRQATKKAKK